MASPNTSRSSKRFEDALKALPLPGKRETPKVQASWFTYEGARPQRTQRFRYPVLEDNKKSLDGITWRNLLAFSRQLFINLGPLRGCILERGTYSVGNAWLPIFRGTDKAWGDKATAWLASWYRNCDVRGYNYDFKTSLFLDSIAIDRDGDIGCLKSQVSETDRYPQIQSIEAHQVYCRNYEQTLDSTAGAYAGKKIHNGVVLNSYNRPIAFQVLGEDIDADRFISANDMQLFYQPEWSTQGRGISALSHCILDAESFQDIMGYLKAQVAIDAHLGLTVHNQTGGADVGVSYINGTNTPAANASEGGVDVQLEQLEGGSIWYFKSNSGDKVEGLNTQRPSQNVDAFLEKLLRNCYQGLEWPYEFTRDGSAIGGANIRLINEKVVRSIGKRQSILNRKAHYATSYALSRAIELGLIPQSSDPMDIFKFDFTMPPLPNVDSGRESQQLREDVRMGLRTRREDFGERGRDWAQERSQLKSEAEDLLTKAQELVTKFGVSLEFAVNLIEKQSPNPPQQALDPNEAPSTPVNPKGAQSSSTAPQEN